MYCTSNLFLSELSEIDGLLKDWSQSKDKDLVAMKTKMKYKFDKYWGDPTTMNLNIFYAAILDPSQKTKFLRFILKAMYGEDKGNQFANFVEEKMKNLFDWYKAHMDVNSTRPPQKIKNSAPSPSNVNTKVTGGGRSKKGSKGGSEIDKPSSRINYLKFMEEEVLVEKELSELDVYLADTIEKVPSGKYSYDVLSCWRLHAPRFPILAAMSCDVLAVSISTVASESAFSTSGRILDDFRSSLTPKIAQALICTQDWLRSQRKYVNDMDDEDELEELELGNFLNFSLV